MEECPICYEHLINPITLACNHTFCYLCVKATLLRGNYSCPMCRAVVDESYLENAKTAVKHVTNQDVVWMYAGRTDGWWCYQSDHSSQIEQAYQENRKTFDIYILSILYRINFEALTQLNTANGAIRKIKRVTHPEPTSVKGVAGLRYVPFNELPVFEVIRRSNSVPEFNHHYWEDTDTAETSDVDTDGDAYDADVPG